MRMCRSCAFGRELEPVGGTASNNMEVCSACNQLSITHEVVQQPAPVWDPNRFPQEYPSTPEEVARGIDEAEDLPWAAQEQATGLGQVDPEVRTRQVFGDPSPQNAPRNAPEPRETASAPSQVPLDPVSTGYVSNVAAFKGAGCSLVAGVILGGWLVWSIIVLWKGW